jgi:hypothetical protein
VTEDPTSLTVGDGETTLELARTDLTETQHLVATLRTTDLSARQRFEADGSLATFKDLADVLSGLANDWKGFDGERAWISSDGAFYIRCTHDGVRAIRALVRLLHLDDWEIELPVAIELGQLDRLEREVTRFFAFAMD